MFANNSLPHPSIKPLNYLLWSILAFQAGTINVGGFLACHRFVTHVTGFATHFGVDVASGSIVSALSMALVPLFFLLGSMASALLIDKRKYLGKEPHYTVTFTFSGISFLTLTIAGQLGTFGAFANSSSSLTNFMILAILSFLSGIQNGMIGFTSGLLVRTTHLTGITTDLGVGLMRVSYPNISIQQKQFEFKMNLLRIGTIASFIVGSTVGGLVFFRFEYLGFLIPSFICLFLAGYSWNVLRIQPVSSQSRKVGVAE
ncbi:MAG: hypothetical protein RJB66_953 [Pseudomonadota bacterium]|jgi:uncharacterized membrane protein YoaK (UPF0700 family)